MKATTGTTHHKNVAEAVLQLQSQLSASQPKLLVYFASSQYPPQELAESMDRAFPGTAVVGCTSAGEIADGQMHKGSIVAMGLPATVITDVAIEVVPGLRAGADISGALATFQKHFGVSLREANHDEFVGLVLMDGLSKGEELLMERLGDATDVVFVGGSAGDDLQFKSTHIFARGRAHQDSALLVLLKPASRFDVVKTQSFRNLGKQLTATRVDEAQRIVLEFDGKPAATAYAQAVGQPVERIAEVFMHNPLGLMTENGPFVRSPMRVEGEAIHFYCNIKEGMCLDLLESTDIIRETQASMERKEEELGPLQAVLNFHCILRTLELESEGQCEAYGKLFGRWPTVGLSTYGEAYLGHINQTSTILVFA